MKRLLQYFLFRLYSFYVDIIREKDIPLFYTSAVFTMVIWFNLFSLTYLLDRSGVISIVMNKSIIITSIVVLGCVNYYFVQRSKFLEQNFEKDKTGGVLVVMVIVSSLLFCISVSHLHRMEV